MVYHGYAGLNNNHQTHNVWRASLSYVTGAHSMKVGYQAAYEVTDIFGDFATHGLQYRFNAGVPDQITQRITKWQQANRTRWDAFYVQDQWTRNRLTLQGALRYERAWSFFPEGLNGLLTDSVFGGPCGRCPRRRCHRLQRHRAAHGDGVRHLRQRQDGHQGERVEVLAVCRQRRCVYRDQPGIDLRADGQPGVDRQPQLQSGLRPPESAGAGQSRHRRRPLRRAGQSELLQVQAGRFGDEHGHAESIRRCSAAGACVHTTGSSARRCSRSCMPRVSAEIGYSRRWWGNFTVTDNLAVGPADFDTYTFTHRRPAICRTSGQPVSYQLRNLRTRSARWTTT